MNLFDTTQTIKGWVRSCTKAEQLDLCEEVVKDYVVNRFTGQVEYVDLIQSEAELRAVINERRVILAAYPIGTQTRGTNHINDII